jgi:hypothetical protein
MNSNMGGTRGPTHQPVVSAAVMWLTVSLLATTAQAKYGGGTGTAEDPYLIYTAEQMNTIGLNKEDWDKHFKLMADLDLSAYKGSSFNRIGLYDPPSFPPIPPTWRPPFSGTFDGNNHTISGFTCVIDARVPLAHRQSRGDENVGLFGYVKGPAASIKNLGLIDPNVCPAPTCSERVEKVGALAGNLVQGTIENCHVRGGTVSGDGYVGGLVGASAGRILRCSTSCSIRWADGRPLRVLDDPILSATGFMFGGLAASSTGEVSFCHSSATVYARDSAGGLLGSNGFEPGATAVVSDCHATGDVSAENDAGGLVGYNAGKIRDCYAAGVVDGNETAGGLVGWSPFKTSAIETSHATGPVSGDTSVGGLAGGNNGTVKACYATGQVAGRILVGGLTGFNLGTLHACYATGDVMGNVESAGGLTGSNGGTVSCCYARGDVTGNDLVGGLVGFAIGKTQYCYATGGVLGKEYVGGLTGGKPDEVIGSFWDIETSGWTADGGGTGKTTAEMQNIWTYFAAGWDFLGKAVDGTEQVWRTICDRPMYPRLAWEGIPNGDFADPEGIDCRDLKVLAQHWLEPIDLPCTGGDISFDTRVNLRDFALLARGWRQGGREILYATTLDANPVWTTQGQWRFGPPQGEGGGEHGYPDPNSGYTGTNVYGVNLEGDYTLSVNGPQYLIAGPFDCSGCRDVKLQFARWLNTDQADFVDATIEVSADGDSWRTIWKYAFTEGELTDNKWKVVTYDIGAVADGQKQVYVRWGYAVLDKEAWAMSGWNIDDIALTGSRE